LRSGLVREVLHTDEHADLVAGAPGVIATLVAPAAMRRLSGAVTPPGVIAVVDTPASDGPLPSGGPVLVLDRLNDPGNVGTLIRSAAALGATAVVVVGTAADPFGPKTVRASSGACYRVPVLRRDTLSEVVGGLRAVGMRSFGLAADAEHTIDAVAGCSDVALVLGSESHGLSDGDVGLDGVLRIPMVGGVESLNVAAAGAIALHTLGRAVTASSDGTAR
jgi:tRNA G18 (ribose-2'-O)-methylase SpoU